jgi:hypothetical protein
MEATEKHKGKTIVTVTSGGTITLFPVLGCRTTGFASDSLFLADAYGSNINAAPAISVGTRAPRKRYSGEIPASPKRDARID